MEQLSQTVIDYARSLGACVTGIATLDTLAGGPPSADLTYVLPDAKSAISFALPLDQNLIYPFLRKKDRLSLERDNLRTNSLAAGISLQLTEWLEQKGYPSIAQAANEGYRRDTPGGCARYVPSTLPEIPGGSLGRRPFRIIG